MALQSLTGTLTIDGIRVFAPSFRDERQFDAAVGRAFCEGIEIIDVFGPDTFVTFNPTNGKSYVTSRRTCSCPAGQKGIACKHQARVIMAEDVLHDTPTVVATAI